MFGHKVFRVNPARTHLAHYLTYLFATYNESSDLMLCPFASYLPHTLPMGGSGIVVVCSQLRNLLYIKNSHFFFAFQIQELKKKQESQVQLLRQKQKSDEAAKRLQDEIQFIKAQKVGIDISSVINHFFFILNYLLI